MIRLGLLLFGTAIALLRFNASALDEDGPRFKTLRVTLLTSKGRPAPGVWVTLRGLDRDAFTNDNPESAVTGASPWRFKSDSRGRFTVRFGRFRTYKSKETCGVFSPGWGEFHLYAEAPHLGSAVSGQIVNPAEPGVNYATGDWSSMEWSGHTVCLKGSQQMMKMRFKAGLRLSGHVLNTHGNPLSGFQVQVYHDLGANTHTGHGGEILFQKATTDHSGKFTISSIYPNRFYFNLGPDQGFWVRTKLRHRWADEIVDEITPTAGEAVIHMKIIVSSKPPFLYHGRITDDEGNPIANAKVHLNVSMHRGSRTWEDSHNGRDTFTASDGRYEFHAEAPFSGGMRVEAAGFVPAFRQFGEKPPFALAPPGNYDFSLQPERGAAE